MKQMKFKVTLSTDVVLNVKSATDGNNQTLDFIPGNNFLGIVAGRLYQKVDTQTAWTLFHSGKVRYGDAHPLVDNHRSLRVPAAIYQPKLDKTESYVSIYTDTSLNAIRKKQLKQCRTGFYAFFNGKGILAKIEKTFAIKSGYDRNSRRSKDEAMYGYESLCAGQSFAFTVEIDDDCVGLSKLLADTIEGDCQIGRSRTAQYGLVKIEKMEFEESSSRKPSGNVVTVYADSRLIFLDNKDNMPTFQPTAEYLGLPVGSHIIWGKSQVRTFQYAPWNFKRQAFDTDRCGIEKGSVIVVECSAECPSESRYVGAYRNEGFGRVIYNPDFLDADVEGKAKFQLQRCECKDADYDMLPSVPASLLQRYLYRRKKQEDELQKIYTAVNEFVANEGGRFGGEMFASQWGMIRKNPDYNTLFEEKTGYLMHGVAKDKWDKKNRRKALMSFLCEHNDLNQRKMLINLASQMAKHCKNKK